MRLFLSFVLLATFVLSGCSSAKVAGGSGIRNEEGRKDSNVTDIDVTTGMDLATYLRRLPGVIVRGDGPAASVQIRRASSFGTITDPLFVVNGSILGTSFAQLFSTVDPAEIAQVKVLKSASETAAYGIQGGNGVLEFKLK